MICGDMRSFDFALIADEANAPSIRFSYLPSCQDALAHLYCVANQLAPESRYLVQLDLDDLEHYQPRAPDATSQWESQIDGVRIKTTVHGGALDRATRIRDEHFLFEVLSGAPNGYSLRESHKARAWDWQEWSELIAASPFRQIAAYDGSTAQRPAQALDANLNYAPDLARASPTLVNPSHQP